LISYSEGFLSASEIELPEVYKSAFKRGRNYSIKYGILLGKIEYFMLNK